MFIGDTVPTTIKHGLPCLVRLISYTPGYPERIRADPNDSYEGCPEEVEWELLTTKGQRAKWMDKFLTPADEERIETLLLECIKK